MKVNSFKYFYPERPKLIHPDQVEQFEGGAWVAEKKWNGSRLCLYRDPFGAWFFWNRHQELMRGYVPSREVVDALDVLFLKGWWAFDGELRHNKTVGVKHKIVLWDVFIADGVLLLDMPFHQRRTLLWSHGLQEENGGPLGIPHQYSAGFREVFEQVSQDDEIEGLVLKRLDGRLSLGRSRAVESNWMRKVRKPSGRYHF
jgi:ATP-dependent DNA ligase